MRKRLLAAMLFSGLCCVASSAQAQGQMQNLPGQWPLNMPQQQFAQPLVVYQQMNHPPQRPGLLQRLLPSVFGPGSVFGSGGASQLPIGRRYIDGRYFGPLNDRYYGPQYGNF